MTLSFQGQKIVKFLLHSYCFLNKRKLQKLFEKTCQSLDKTHKICRNKDKTFLMKITKMTRNWKCFSLYTSPEPLRLTKTKDGLSEREWVVSGVFTVVKYLLFFCVNVCIVHFQSNAVILFYWQIPNKRNTWLLKREPVSPTLPGWKKSKQYRFSVCCKSFRNDAKYNISSYLKMGNIFSSPRGWVHRFHLLGLILQKNNKIWEISNCKCRVFEYVSFLLSFQGAFRSWKHLRPPF